MAVKTIAGQAQVDRLVKLYRYAEQEISQKIALALAKNGGQKKVSVRQLEQQLKAVQSTLKGLQKGTEEPVSKLINSAFNGGLSIARKEIKKAGIPLAAVAGGVNAKAMNIYASQVYARLMDVVTMAGRTATDVYKALEMDTAMTGLVSGFESLDAVKRKMERIAEGNGLVAFVDSRGRQWSMGNYVDMLLRTSSMHVFNEARKSEYLRHNEDLVVVSSHEPTCEMCEPWNGAILSLTGTTDGYQTLEQAQAEGLFHPNCRHVYSLYVEYEPEKPAEPDEPENDDPAEGFVPAESINEAKQWAQDHGLAKHIDYTGLKLETINELNAGIYNTQALFPDLKSQFDFIGSSQEHFSFVYDVKIKERMESLRKLYPNATDKDLEAVAQRLTKKPRVEGNVLALSVRTPGAGGISINSKFGGNVDLFKFQVDYAVQTGYHPVGCSTIKSVVDHEMAHEIDKLLKLSDSSTVIDMYKSLKASGQMASELSRYATTDIQEFIAEAWAEFQNNPTPRPTAKAIGEYIMSFRGGTKP